MPSRKPLLFDNINIFSSHSPKIIENVASNVSKKINNLSDSISLKIYTTTYHQKMI